MDTPVRVVRPEPNKFHDRLGWEIWNNARACTEALRKRKNKKNKTLLASN
jgi:hypothetical protein